MSKDSSVVYNSEIIFHEKNEFNIKTVEDISNNKKYVLTPNGVEIYDSDNLISIDEDYINFDQKYAGIQKIDLSSSGIYKYIKINKHEIIHYFNLYNSKTAIHYLGNNYIISNAVLSFTTYKSNLNTMFTISGMEYIGITEETREPYHIELIFYYPKYEDKPW